MLDSTENDADLDELAHVNWLGCSQAQDAHDSIKALSDRVWDWFVVDHYDLIFIGNPGFGSRPENSGD